MIYAILGENDEFLEWREFDVLPAHKPGRVRPQIATEIPAHNEVTHKAVEGAPIVEDDGVRQVWTIVEKTAEERRRTWTTLEFMLLFTPEERAAVRAVAASDLMAADFLQLLQAAQEVVSDNPLVAQGMGYLAMLGALSPERMTEILNSSAV